MPCAVPFPVREQIVQRLQQGEPLAAIARDLNMPDRTVCKWWRRDRDEGAAGRQTRYRHGGPQGPKTAAEIHAAALAMKREHPSWGAALIRVPLLEPFPGQPVAQIRGIQRWFHAAGLPPRRAQSPPRERERAQEPHALWQRDAKEQMRRADGRGTCVWTVTDEASGAVLGLAPFPPVAVDPCRARDGAADAARAL